MAEIFTSNFGLEVEFQEWESDDGVSRRGSTIHKTSMDWPGMALGQRSNVHPYCSYRITGGAEQRWLYGLDQAPGPPTLFLLLNPTPFESQN